jgi:hypothetical protein
VLPQWKPTMNNILTLCLRCVAEEAIHNRKQSWTDKVLTGPKIPRE